jgi:hypothetical protein
MQVLQGLLTVVRSLPRQQQQQQLNLPDAQVVPILLCCVEAALLAPAPYDSADAQLLPAMSCLALGMKAAVAVVLDAVDDGEFSAGVSVQVTEKFAGPMLQLLAPAVQQSLRLAVGKQQQQDALDSLLSAEDLESHADLRYKTSELWSILVYWEAVAAGVCRQC